MTLDQSTMTNKTNLAQKTIQGVIWEYTSKYSGKLLNFVTITILARLLLQEDFGVAGYALVFIGFFEIPGLGVGQALIYFDDDNEQTSTGFWLTLLIGLLLFAICWLSAPLAGIFFRDPRAVSVVQILAFILPISSFGVVPEAYLRKGLFFRRKFAPDLSMSLFKGISSVILAWLGFGAWSLIWGQLIGTLAGVIAFWFVVPWRPSFIFVPRLVPRLLRYSASIVSIYILGILLLNVDYLLIGRYLGAAALGVYTLAFRIPELLIKQFHAIIRKVLFPVLSKIRDDDRAFRHAFLTSLQYITTLTVPLGLGIALVSRPFILTFFTEKWAEAIPIMSAIALYTLLRSLFFSAGTVYKSMGRPEILTYLNLLNVLVIIGTLWAAITYYGTLEAIAWTQVIVALVVGLFRLHVLLRFLNISYARIFADLPARACWRLGDDRSCLGHNAIDCDLATFTPTTHCCICGGHQLWSHDGLAGARAH